MSQPLDARAAELLKLLVERCIHDGQPVGPRTLSRMASLGLSSATIRNVMADLDELGFVASPHTSDGRIPTTRSEEHTSELQSLMRISYAVLCLQKTIKNTLKTNYS